MANFFLSPNMSLPIPTVDVDPGPDWALNLNQCQAIIDSHNHSAGNGVQITPNGLNINADLPFGSNNAINLRSVRFTSQVSPISGVSDLGCLYVSGVDLYYNDESGNQVRITASGAVAGTPGSISGLVAPASASYNGGTGTFIFQSGANIPGNLDGASLTIRDQSLASNGITINAPVSLASNYSITLPSAVPGSQSFVTLDNSGNLGASIPISQGINTSNIANSAITTPLIADGAVTNVKLAPLGQQFGTSSGSTSTGTSFVDVAGDVTITTTGRPVFLSLQQDTTTTTGAYLQSNNTLCEMTFYVDTVEFASMAFGVGGSGSTARFAPSGFSIIDTFTTAGSHTYKIQVRAVTGSVEWNNIRIIAYEIG